MIDVSARIKAAFRDDSVLKHYFIDFIPPVDVEDEDYYETITNDSISSESMQITETLCSEEQLHYGRCESCYVEFEMLNLYESLNGAVFDLYLQLGEYDDEIFTVGRYKVDSETVSNDRKTSQISAYDVMYDLRDLDLTAYYYEDFVFPMTLKQIRDKVFETIGQVQEEITLVNDDVTIPEDPLSGQSMITFSMIMEPICEVNGVFGHIGRDGIFKYVSLDSIDDEETYPGKDTYPSKDLYPKSIRSSYYNYPKSLCKCDMWWENYKCKMIDRVQARNKNGAAVAEYAVDGRESGTNIYVIQDNWVIFALDEATIQTVIRNFAEKIKLVTYTPVDIETKMDLSMEVGDGISFITTDNQRVSTYILQRTMSGIHSAFDSIESLGYEEFINSSPNVDGRIDELQDQLNDLSNQVSDIGSQYSNIRIISTNALPASPEKNVLYLIQGTVYVN